MDNKKTLTFQVHDMKNDDVSQDKMVTICFVLRCYNSVFPILRMIMFATAKMAKDIGTHM
jgi:hypothetical protein